LFFFGWQFVRIFPFFLSRDATTDDDDDDDDDDADDDDDGDDDDDDRNVQELVFKINL